MAGTKTPLFVMSTLKTWNPKTVGISRLVTIGTTFSVMYRLGRFVLVNPFVSTPLDAPVSPSFFFALAFSFVLISIFSISLIYKQLKDTKCGVQHD